MSKLSVEQAWQHVKALWPDAEHIRKSGDRWSAFLTVQCMEACVAAGMGECIDWGDLDRYPPPEPTYREPTQDDVGKMVEVRQSNNFSWVPRKLIAVLNQIHRDRFVCERVATAYDTLWMQARIAVDVSKTGLPHPDAQPIATAPKDCEVELLMGGEWFLGAYGGTMWVTRGHKKMDLSWDRDNQPTFWRSLR